MIIAYLRVSTEKQNLSNQRSEIERFALQKGISIDRWIMEIASGKKAGKERQLGHLLRRFKKMRHADYHRNIPFKPNIDGHHEYYGKMSRKRYFALQRERRVHV